MTRRIEWYHFQVNLREKILVTTDHGETCENGRKKIFLSDSPKSGTIRFVSSWRIQRAIVWSILRENFFCPFSRVWVLIVVPKSEKVDFTAKIVSDALSFVLESSFFSKSVNLRSYPLPAQGKAVTRDFWNLTNLFKTKKKKERKISLFPKEREKSLSLSLFRSNIYKWRVKNCFNTQDKPMTTELSFNESQCKNCSIVYDTRVE